MSRSSLCGAVGVAAAVLALCVPAAAVTVYPAPPATTTPIDLSAGDQVDAHVSGSLVAYTDFSSGNGVIRYHDLGSGVSGAVPVAGPGSDSLSTVDGATIAYVHTGTDGSHRIYTYTVGAAAPVEIDPVSNPNRRRVAIGGNTVAWWDYGLNSNASPEIVVYDRTTGVATRLTDDGSTDEDPSVDPSGTVVTWSKCTSLRLGCDIWDATLAGGTWTTRQLTNDSAEESDPHTDGTVVTYVSDRGGDTDVRWQPVAGGTEQSLALPGEDQDAHVSGGSGDDFVTFEHFDAGAPAPNFEIYGYDLTTDALYRFTDTREDEFLNDVSVQADGTAQLVFSRAEATGDDNVYATSFVLPAMSHTTLTSPSPATVTALTQVKLRAIVTAGAGATGAVQFAANGVALEAPVALAGGLARLTTRLPAGTDAVTANYLGNGQARPSESAPLVFTVNRVRSTTTVVATDPDSATQGLSAHVSSALGAPTGSVQFFTAGSRPLGSPVALDASGTAQSTTALPPGLVRVRAQYLGDGTYLSSSGAGPQFVVPRMTNSVGYGPTAADGSARADITVQLNAVSGYSAPTGRVVADQGFHCAPLVVRAQRSSTTCGARIPENTTETVAIHYRGDGTYAVTDGAADVSLGGW